MRDFSRVSPNAPAAAIAPGDAVSRKRRRSTGVESSPPDGPSSGRTGGHIARSVPALRYAGPESNGSKSVPDWRVPCRSAPRKECHLNSSNFLHDGLSVIPCLGFVRSCTP